MTKLTNKKTGCGKINTDDPRCFNCQRQDKMCERVSQSECSPKECICQKAIPGAVCAVNHMGMPCPGYPSVNPNCPIHGNPQPPSECGCHCSWCSEMEYKQHHLCKNNCYKSVEPVKSKECNHIDKPNGKDSDCYDCQNIEPTQPTWEERFDEIFENALKKTNPYSWRRLKQFIKEEIARQKEEHGYCMPALLINAQIENERNEAKSDLIQHLEKEVRQVFDDWNTDEDDPTRCQVLDIFELAKED